MKKVLKYTLLGLSLFLLLLGIIMALCWAADVDVTLGEVIKAELIAILAVCFIAVGCTCIMGIIETIKED